MNLVFIDGDLRLLRKRLRKGQIVKGRIVLILAENHYLLRLMGHNLVMRSTFKFKRLQEVFFKVVRISPKIELRVFDPLRELVFDRKQHVTDITV